MNDAQTLEQLAATDAYAPQTPLPAAAWSRDAVLAEVERRTDMQTQKRTPQQTPSRGYRQGWLVAAAAFALVLIVGGAMLLWPERSSDPAIEPTTTVPTTATTIPPPSETAVPPMVESWQRVGAEVMNPVVGLFDMTQAESGLVAVGFDPGEEDFRQNGVIFTSDDGVTWTRLAEDDPALTLGAVLMYGVTEGGPGLVAVGIGCEDDTQPCPAYATAWTSTDGTAWTRTPYDAAVFGDTATQSSSMLDVVTTAGGNLVAVGAIDYWTLDEAGVEQSVIVHPAVWTSPDGVTWERSWEGTGVELTPSVFAEVLTPPMRAVSVGADGRLVAVGSTLDQDGKPVAAVWVSPDGNAWERIDATSLAFGPQTVMSDVASGSSGFVAVGSEGGAEAAIWQSLDGYTWTQVDVTNQPFGTTGTLSTVAALDSGFVAAGPDLGDERGGWVTLWTSPDGSTWDRVHAIGEGYAASVVATDAGIAVAGAMTGADDWHAAVWAGPTFDPYAPPPDPQPPVPAEEQAEEASGIGALEEGVSCEAIAEQGFGYAEALSYWLRYELTEDFDLDADGVPCADAYTAVEVSEAFGEPDALAIHFVSDHPTATFVATGPAVEAGLVCSVGTIDYTENPQPIGPTALWRWEDLYTCDDGSGTFLLGVDEYIEDGQSIYGIWDIVTGTGTYETLQGGGATDSIFDGYDASIGRLWLESNEN